MSAPRPRRRQRPLRRRKRRSTRPLPSLWPALLVIIAMGLAGILVLELIVARRKHLREQIQREDSVPAVRESPYTGRPL